MPETFMLWFWWEGCSVPNFCYICPYRKNLNLQDISQESDYFFHTELDIVVVMSRCHWHC